METFYVTFGVQYSREPHPKWKLAHPDGVLAIRATDYATARSAAFDHLGRYWSDIYDAEGWAMYSYLYPRGVLGCIVAS